MEEIININQNDQGEAQVSARELYQALEVKKSYRFSQWFETNAKQLIENEDFTSVDATTVVNNGAIKTIQDYSLTVDAAKQIALMSGTEKASKFVCTSFKLKKHGTAQTRLWHAR